MKPIKTPIDVYNPKSLIGRICELSNDRNPNEVVSSVIKVAKPTSFIVFKRASKRLEFPSRNSSKYFVTICTTSDIPTTNIMVGSKTVIISSGFPSAVIKASVHIIERMTTINGTHTPQNDRKEMYRNRTISKKEQIKKMKNSPVSRSK